MKVRPMNLAAGALLRLMALMFNTRPSLRKYLSSSDGWINFTVSFAARDGSVEQAITFRDGKVSVSSSLPENPDVLLTFTSEQTVKDMLSRTPGEMLHLILHNRMILDGNLAYLQLFNFYTSLLLGGVHQRMQKRMIEEDKKKRRGMYPCTSPGKAVPRTGIRREAGPGDAGVKHLDDPSLSAYSLDDFPRLKGFLDRHFEVVPEICVERPVLLTRWFREHGFECDSNGEPWVPELRSARAFSHLMEHRKPIIAHDDLVAGTTTAREPTGVVIYPDAQGTMIWGELRSVSSRILNPYRISGEDIDALHDVFAFWARRNFHEWARIDGNNPLSLKIDQRWVFYFVWKSVGISHTVPDFPRLFARGTLGIMEDIDVRLGHEPDRDKRNALMSMRLCLDGVNAYARHLREEAEALAGCETRPGRKGELERLARVLARVPMLPPETLDEAVNALWIMWVALHMENTNTGLSLGRLDAWLQPYFEHDMARCSSQAERDACVRHALELTGCFFMRCTDHLPLVPDLGNHLFGGSSSDQAITLGGVTPDGYDAVNDMTYIILKVTEMLSIRDPNVNARYHPAVNSDTYLKRLCEVNVATAATPSMHGDPGIFEALGQHGYPVEDVRDWSSTGCVEPTLSGRHMGHTGSILMNMVAALEMALNNGCHPLTDWTPGPETGRVEDFTAFDAFFDAYAAQQQFLIDQACALNDLLGEIHARRRPTPLLSALIRGSIERGLDVTKGGALYNTSGSSNIGLADVTDSLMVIKKLVFDEKMVSFTDLKKAVDDGFSRNPALHALVKTRVPLFGSGDPEALAMARRVARLVHNSYAGHVNCRGGRYTSGFWSMSQHVAYGSLSGALPSGRLKGKAFTPGLTPHPSASRSFLDNIRDVSSLDPSSMDNNIAFNVKIVPGVKDTLEELVNTMHAYVKSFFSRGGMQMQFNVVTSETLKDAMVHPENHRTLLVRISGYNAYFTTLNPEMQVELIERAEYGL